MNPVAAQKPINYQEVIKNKIKTWDEDKLNARVTAEMNNIRNNKNLNEIEQNEQIEKLKSQKVEPRNLKNPEEIVKALQEYSEKFTSEDLNQIIAMRRTWQDSQVDNKTIDKLNSTLQKSLSVFANLFKMNQAIIPKELTKEILFMLSPEDLKLWEDEFPQIKGITQDISFQSKVLIINNQFEKYARIIVNDLTKNKPLNKDVIENLFNFASLEFQSHVSLKIVQIIEKTPTISFDQEGELIANYVNQIPSSVKKLAPPVAPPVADSPKYLSALSRFTESPNELKELEILPFMLSDELLKKILKNSQQLERIISLLYNWEVVDIIQDLKNLKNLNVLELTIPPIAPGREEKLKEIINLPNLKNLKISFSNPFTLKKEWFSNKNFNLTIQNVPGIELIIKEIPSHIPITISLLRFSDYRVKEDIEDLKLKLKDIIEKHGNIKIEVEATNLQDLYEISD